ncbi:ATP-dependent sacrificial sulfur transferase LarE [Pseudodesulfovibrio sp. JC047]|uniref:ATP-dependent sacrificial sulfur transferase LarE n=1 Tax=Pseudodesulfovibrio sp. JC047 TaxID=2683199 RepID=UPI0013D8616A|nr:ATP-dependent sacrificial sulfur transferase LarE [Pseudodesulfovibrio sp. JC047]NDV18479.1 ATP-dependent sacrificial sulfur transferase LarE [Pseudodesulfovibrio sp. JC047]
MTDALLHRYDTLIQKLTATGGALVAFSGGVDSTLLLYAAYAALGDKAVAATIVTPYIPRWEITEAKAYADTLGVTHVELERPFPEALRMNPPDHCYTCKKYLFSELVECARNQKIPCVLDGTNLDDLDDYRPGLKALRELKIGSPLLDAGLTKQDIRDLSRHFGLPTGDKPSFACLLSRMPIGSRVTETALRQVENAERSLMDMGFPAVRVRHHGDVARIEVPQDDIGTLVTHHGPAINDALKKLGYRHVAVDLAGYSMGSLNRTNIIDDTENAS